MLDVVAIMSKKKVKHNAMKPITPTTIVNALLTVTTLYKSEILSMTKIVSDYKNVLIPLIKNCLRDSVVFADNLTERDCFGIPSVQVVLAVKLFHFSFALG